METTTRPQERDSSIELFRIIVMLVIVAHHYVVNSGLMEKISENPLSLNAIFLLLFGWGGKTGINCFVLITGYFMCKSEISSRKFIKLFLEIYFYSITIYLIFLSTGYSEFSVKQLLKTILPIYGIKVGSFVGSYMVFFLFIPFLNILLKNMGEKLHVRLILLCVIVFSIFQTLFMARVTFSYVGWFMVLYTIGAYIRMYPKDWFNNKWIFGWGTLLTLAASLCSVVVCAFITTKYGKGNYYFFVSDSNKFLALFAAVFSFIYFLNLRIGYSKIINTVALSAFGVLLIHGHSDAMREWLWHDVLANVNMYNSKYLILHAFGSVMAVYIVCTIIDMIRIKLIEKPFFKWFDKKTACCKQQDQTACNL